MHLGVDEMAEQETDEKPSRQSQARFTLGSIFHFPYLFDRPVGIGVLVGSAVGVLNSLILSLPILTSTIVGATLGALVCIVTGPAMRSIAEQHRQRRLAVNVVIQMRSRAGSAFTSHE